MTLRVKRSRWPLGLAMVLTASLIAACARAPMPEVAPPEAAGPSTVEPAVQEAVASLATAVQTLMAGWTVHEDAEAGYSLSYPPDVHINSGKSRAGVHTTRIQFRVPGVEGYQGMLVRVEPNPAGAGVEQAAAAIYERLMGQAATSELADAFEKLSVDGLAGVRMGAGGDFAIVVPYADKVYIIAPVHDQATTALDPQALALFSQVLATLRIRR